MDKRDKEKELFSAKNEKVAPGLDEEDSYGKNASKTDMKQDNTTKVTRLINDEYDHS
ncbi:hypothetical protein ACM26V_21575 [Salipaludibacillus sp. HK11]|uniref:hypothetical protein n=1 Tax=Salipaludibacillus sp. HK11 TaxID=3394320 RepID=UPI0039FCD8A7